MEEQVISRAHRMGAMRPIHVETLAMNGTIEEQMLKFLQVLCSVTCLYRIFTLYLVITDVKFFFGLGAIKLINNLVQDIFIYSTSHIVWRSCKAEAYTFCCIDMSV